MDPLEIQRLVDGELLPADRKQLLKRIDLTPDDWRTVALALLEEQSFSREISKVNVFQNFANHFDDSNSTRVSQPYSADLSTFSLFRHPGWKGIVVSAVLAASVLVAVGVTIVQPWFENPSVPSNSATSIANSNRSSPLPLDPAGNSDWGSPVGELSLASDDATVQPVRNGNAFEDEMLPNVARNRIPVYEVHAEQAKRWMDDEARRIASWREQLRRRGYELDSKPNRIEKTLPDGRALIVPVNQWNVRPIGQ